MRMFLYAGLLLAVAGCYPGEVTSLSELDAVVTFKNPETNYAALATYAIADTVVQIDEDSSNVQISHEFDKDIVAKVKARLNAYGFSELTWDVGGVNPDTPDVFVLVSAVADTYTAYTYTPGYWWGYWGWYYPPCYYCYPGYPGYITSTKFDAGSLFVDLLETASFSPADSTVRFGWTASINGILGATASNVQRVTAGLDQAFDQSPYLGDGK